MNLVERLRGSTTRSRLVLIAIVSLLGTALSLGVAFAQVRATVLEERSAKTRQVVESAMGVLDYYAKAEETGKMTRAQAQEQALGVLSGMRYDGQEYFWVLRR